MKMKIYNFIFNEVTASNFTQFFLKFAFLQSQIRSFIKIS